MKYLLSWIFVFLVLQTGFCQKKSRTPEFIVIIEDKKNNFVITGALYDISDSSLIITCSFCKEEKVSSFHVPVAYDKIDNIKIIHKNKILLSRFLLNTALILEGLIDSATLFAAISYSFDDGFQSQYNKQIGNSLFPLILGGTIISLTITVPGVIVGMISKNKYLQHISISKKHQSFFEHKEQIKKYCFVQ